MRLKLQAYVFSRFLFQFDQTLLPLQLQYAPIMAHDCWPWKNAVWERMTHSKCNGNYFSHLAHKLGEKGKKWGRRSVWSIQSSVKGQISRDIFTTNLGKEIIQNPFLHFAVAQVIFLLCCSGFFPLGVFPRKHMKVQFIVVFSVPFPDQNNNSLASSASLWQILIFYYIIK